MVKYIVGGVITLVIGGTTFAVNQKDVASNFAQNTGVSQEQAQQYVDNIPKSELQSFSKIGESYVTDGSKLRDTAVSLDCTNYSYSWVSASLSCLDGKMQVQTLASDETTLGMCYKALDTDLGKSAKDKISECVSDIDQTNRDLDQPIVSVLSDTKSLTESKNTGSYNKSVLQAALKAK